MKISRLSIRGGVPALGEGRGLTGGVTIGDGTAAAMNVLWATHGAAAGFLIRGEGVDFTLREPVAKERGDSAGANRATTT